MFRLGLSEFMLQCEDRSKIATFALQLGVLNPLLHIAAPLGFIHVSPLVVDYVLVKPVYVSSARLALGVRLGSTRCSPLEFDRPASPSALGWCLKLPQGMTLSCLGPQIPIFLDVLGVDTQRFARRSLKTLSVNRLGSLKGLPKIEFEKSRNG